MVVHPEVGVGLGTINIVEKHQPIVTDLAAPQYINTSTQLTFNYDAYVKADNNQIVTIAVAIGQVTTTDVLGWTQLRIQGGQYLLDQVEQLVNLKLKHNQNYTLYVKVLGKDNSSAAGYYSNAKATGFKVDLTPPIVPQDSKIYVNQNVGGGSDSGGGNQPSDSNGNVQYLSWTSATDNESGIASYELQYQNGTSQKWEEVSSVLTTNAYRMDNMDPTKRFRYKVRAYNNAGSAGEWMLSDYTDTEKPADVIYDVSCYPNPFRSAIEGGTLYYELNQDASVGIKIYDGLGHFVRELDYAEGKMGGTSAEPNQVVWDGTNQAGQKVAKGGYIAVITASKPGPHNKVRLMIGVIH